MQRHRVERCGDGHAQNVLAQNVEAARLQRRRILGAEIIAIERRPAFQHLEPVGRHQQAL